MSAFTPRAPRVTTTVNPSEYTLPIASDSVLGGIKVGTSLEIDGSGVLNLNNDAIQFNIAVAVPSYAQGNTYWDVGNHTLTTDLEDGVRLQHGQEIHVIGYNDTGVTIANGKCVYISGAFGDHPTVALAKADSLTTSDTLIGIATQDILNNDQGYVTILGKVRDLDTSALSLGAVYLSASVAGAVTSTRPTYPNRAIRVGFVTEVNATTGTILVATEDYADAQDILLPASGTPNEIVDVLDWFRHSWSTGLTDGGAITDNGDGTVNIAASDFLLRQGSAEDDPLVVYRDSGVSNIAVTANDVSYIYLNYNGGTPAWAVGSTISDFNGIDTVIAYIVARNGSRTNIIDLRQINVDSGRKNRRQKVEFDGFVYKGWWRSSLAASSISSSGLNLLVGAGRYYYFDNLVTHDAFDTTVAGAADANNWIYFYNRTGTWTQVTGQKSINQTQYDNAGTLTTMTNNRYRTDWVYVVLDGAVGTPYLVVILGNTEHLSLAAAQADSIPATLPPQIDGASVLVGQVVIQKSAATVTVQQAGGAAFTGAAGASTHNNLSGLQGGVATEFYHSTAAEYAGTGTGVFVRTSSPTLTSPAINGTVTTTGLTLPAFTLGGAITGNSQNISGLGTLGCGAITSSGAISGTSLSAGNGTFSNNVTINKTAGDLDLDFRTATSGTLAQTLRGFNTNTNLATATGGVTLTMQNLNNTANNYNVILNADAGGNGNSAIYFVNVSDPNNEGYMVFSTRPSGGSLTEGMRLDSSGNIIHKVNSTAPTLSTNSTLTFELTSNTELKVKVRGSDGTTRSVSLTLA